MPRRRPWLSRNEVRDSTAPDAVRVLYARLANLDCTCAVPKGRLLLLSLPPSPERAAQYGYAWLRLLYVLA